VARESSRVEARESSRVVAWGSSVSYIYSLGTKISLKGFSVGFAMVTGVKLETKSKTATLKEIPPFEPTWKSYEEKYPVVVNSKTAILYKAVHKKDGVYFSDYDKNFTYIIGGEKTETVDTNKHQSCSAGIHVSHKSWARGFGASWDDMALLECEVNIKDIVVSSDCDGKVRASKIKVTREVPESEWFDLVMA